MPRARRKLPKGIHIHESIRVSVHLLCYKNEHGTIIRENTHQTDVRAAELMLAQARTDVAMKRRFTSLSFERVKFIDLFNEWWSNHGSRTRSKFEYRTPRVLGRFKTVKAREITPDAVRSFLSDLRAEGLAASSINQCRTILCSVFNYAIRFEKYDKNPVSVVPQEKEPPGRDRFPEPEEIVQMIRVCDAKGDLELKAFLVLAPTTGMRKGEILSRRWSDIDVDSGNPCIYVRLTKTMNPSESNCPTWRSTLSSHFRAMADTSTFSRPNPTRGLRAILRGRMRGILERGSDSWRSSLAWKLYGYTIYATSRPRP
jgi:integrase